MRLAEIVDMAATVTRATQVLGLITQDDVPGVDLARLQDVVTERVAREVLDKHKLLGALQPRVSRDLLGEQVVEFVACVH